MSPLFPLIQSDLDLNGPILSFTTQPVGTSCSVASGIATFIGIATATFPTAQTERETNTGTVTYQWYNGTTALTNGANVTGTATTTLTLSGLTSPLLLSEQVFVQAGYAPDDLSPNAINEPLNSDDATLTVFPTISIDTQPEEITVVEDIATTFTVDASASDGTDSLLGYQWYLNGVELSDSSLVSGSKSATLTITRENPNLDKVYCEVKHSTAQPGIVTSTEANLDVASARTFIQWELIGNNARQSSGARDLATAGPFTARARTDINARIIQMFSPERDVDVKITLGGAGGGSRSGNKGGAGGISVFKMKMKQNTEYTVKLGISHDQGKGPRGGINYGGGLAVIYEKATVVAVCGGGGGAGTGAGGNGGNGGGCGQQGDKGGGNNGGNGGETYEFSNNGHTQVGPTRNGADAFDNDDSGSGKLSGCTIGGWWRTNGGIYGQKDPCEDVGTGVPFYSNSGSILSDTTHTDMKNLIGPITRGYKPGQGFRNNGGAGSGNGGGGGAGARGGQGSSNGGGGGGASGYIDSKLTLLESTTLSGGNQVGGNVVENDEGDVVTDVAFISVEAYSANDDQEPLIPEYSDSKSPSRTVNWNPQRSAGDNNTLEFVIIKGTGPKRIQFGPNADQVAQNSQIKSGSEYQLVSVNNASGRGITLRIKNNELQGADNPNNLNYGDIQIRPDQGLFESNGTLPVKIQGTPGEGGNPQPEIRWKTDW